MSGEEFDWWFDGNPAGSLRSVAVLTIASSPLRGTPCRRGARWRAADGELFRTRRDAPSARGRGIFVELERKHEREAQEMGVACVLAFASAPTAPLFLGPLGWSAIGKLRVWARPAWGMPSRSDGIHGRQHRRCGCRLAESRRPRRRIPQVALSQLAPRLRALRHRRRLRRCLAGQAAQGTDDLRGSRPRWPDRPAVRGTTASAGAVPVCAAGARAAAGVPRGRLSAHSADAELHGQGTGWSAEYRSPRLAGHPRRHGLLLRSTSALAEARGRRA